MSFAANLVYLEDERKNIIQRISQIARFLKQNPHISIFQRKISGKIYCYKKYRRGSRSLSQYLGKPKAIPREELEKIKQQNQRVNIAKQQLALAKIELRAIEKQLKIVRKVYEHERTRRTEKTA